MPGILLETDMKRIAIVLALGAAAAGPLRAQQADLRVASGAMGYGSPRITGLGSLPD
jgi:hypothetical protein